MSSFWTLFELRVMEVMVTTGANKTCKAPVNKLLPPTNQHSAFYMLDSLPVAQPTVSKQPRKSGNTSSK